MDMQRRTQSWTECKHPNKHPTFLFPDSIDANYGVSGIGMQWKYSRSLSMRVYCAELSRATTTGSKTPHLQSSTGLGATLLRDPHLGPLFVENAGHMKGLTFFHFWIACGVSNSFSFFKIFTPNFFVSFVLTAFYHCN